MIKKILLVLAGVLIVIQFIRPAENHNTNITAQDITRMFPVSDSVHTILEKACNDCHTNSTRYPWYNRIQPVAWWLAYHVNGGKKHLNFSEFGSYPKAKQVKRLKGIAKEVTEGGMPLDSYLWIHKDAVLTEDEKQVLINWANGLGVMAAERK